MERLCNVFIEMCTITLIFCVLIPSSKRPQLVHSLPDRVVDPNLPTPQHKPLHLRHSSESILFPNSWDYGHTSWREAFKDDKPEEITAFQTRENRAKSLATPDSPRPSRSASQEKAEVVVSPTKETLPTYKSILDELEGNDLKIKTTKRGAKLIMAGTKEKLLRCVVEKSWDDPNLQARRSDTLTTRRWKKKYEEYQAKTDGDMFVVYFLFTHTYFMDTMELLEELIKRYNQAAAKLQQPEKLSKEEQTFQMDIKTRILFIIKRWIINSLDDLLEMQRSDLLLNFMNSLDKAGNVDQFNSLSRVYKIALLQKESLTPAQPLDKKEQKIKSIKSFTDVPESYMARQMTLMDFKAFCNVKTRDLLHKNWATGKAPRIQEINQTFSGITLWAATEVLSLPNLKNRTAILAKLISLCNELIQLNNYQSAAAIHAALTLSCVVRLEHTWRVLEEKYPKNFTIWRDIQDLFSPFHNHENYRERIKKVIPPLIPYHMIYLRDLEEIEDSYPNRENDLVNWKKLRKLGRIIAAIRKYQQISYPFAPNAIIHAFLSQHLYVLEIDKLNELSKKYEPPTVEDTDRRSFEDVHPRQQRRPGKGRETSNTIKGIISSSAPATPYRRDSFIRNLDDQPVIDPVIEVLMDSKMDLISAICQIKGIDSPTTRDVSRAIIAIYEISSKSLLLMKKLVYRELELKALNEKTGVSVISSLYKDDTAFPNQILSQYGIMVARSALAKPISALVRKLNSSEKTYEVLSSVQGLLVQLEPLRMSKKEEPRVNSKNVQKRVNNILKWLTEAINDIPYPIRVLCFDVKEVVLQFTKSKELAIRGAVAFCFYRVILPAILEPDLYGVADKMPSKETKRVLYIITQALMGVIATDVSAVDPYLRETVGGLGGNFKGITEFVDGLLSEIPDSSYDFAITYGPGEQQEAAAQIKSFVVANLEYFDNKMPSPKILNCFIIQKVFGYPLYAVIRREDTGSKIPTILEKTTKFLLEYCKNKQLEGLFRISGEAVKVNSLRVAFDNGEYVDLSNADPYVVAEVLKLYFKQLPESLIPSEFFEQVMNLPSISNKEERLQKSKLLLSKIPTTNYNVLKFIIKFMKDISAYAATTMMGAHNLALMFAPNLARPPKTKSDPGSIFSTAHDFVEDMVENYAVVFEST